MPQPKDRRPSPEALLAQVQRSEARARTGELKIYLGMSAGVGKTYSMLSDALQLRESGTDVVAGYIEPHGRKETDVLAKKFETIPPLRVDHNGVVLTELDLDAALARKPEILLVDELAHTNAPACRHQKRYQDIGELLDAGISVYSTVNIQHLESLKDVVAHITGTVVQETVPDSFFGRANKIELVDIPPEELIQRLREGKIYSPEKVETALANFFREGNLMALRELVLRQVADRVDAEMRLYRQENAVDDIWPTAPRIVVCVAPNTLSNRVVRAGARLATTLKGQLIAVSIENSRYAALTETQRRQAVRALAAAEELGAEVVVRQNEDIVGAILDVAREKNATAIVTGKPFRVRWRELIFGTVVDELIRRSGEISVHVVSSGKEDAASVRHISRPQGFTPKAILMAVGLTALMTAVCFIVDPFLAPANLIMIYLLGVAWISTRRGGTESALTALLSVLAFDFCFVPPRWTFAVADAQYVLTFVVMLIVGLLISKLAQRLKGQTQLSIEREQRTAALYALTRQLSHAIRDEDVADVLSVQLKSSFQCESALFVVDRAGDTQLLGGSPSRFESESNERAVVQWVREKGKAAGAGTDTLGAAVGRYLPLEFDRRVLGVLALRFADPDLSVRDRDLLEAFANQAAHTLHRMNLERESRAAQLEVEGEKLRNTLLSAVSHDLRTPLASIAGAASTLLEHATLDDATRTELASTIYSESGRLSRMLRNILDVARLESGQLRLKLEWHSLEEIVGSALRHVSGLLNGRKVTIGIPEDLPLIQVDGILLEQLFVNLLENTSKHTPQDAGVSVTAHSDGQHLYCELSDTGPGLPVGEEEKIFEKLHRGPDRGQLGFGLGLTICRAIAEAHGGGISAGNRKGGGAAFRIELPVSPDAPVVDPELRSS